MKVEIRHHQLTHEEFVERRIKMCNDLFAHLMSGHGLTPERAADAVLRDLAKMLSWYPKGSGE